MLQTIKPVQKGFILGPIFIRSFRDNVLAGFHLVKSSFLHFDAGFRVDFRYLQISMAEKVPDENWIYICFRKVHGLCIEMEYHFLFWLIF